MGSNANIIECSEEDIVLEAERRHTWRRNEPVKLFLDPTAEGAASETPETVISLLKSVSEKLPEHPALAEKLHGVWRNYSYKEYYDLVRKTAKAFIKLGLEPFNGVGIIGFNSPEWLIADLAAIFAGGLAVGIYTTNSPEACHYVAAHAQCNILVVENAQQLDKVLQVRDQLPHLRAIIQYKGAVQTLDPRIHSWSEMLAMVSSDVDDELERLLEQRIANQTPNKCCTLIYTSGTTGDPKGVMLSHDNVVWSGKRIVQISKADYGTEVLLSYLPLSHVAAQLLDIYTPISCAATVYFAQPDALKGSLGATLKEVRPTYFMGVPRVWEKIQEAMTAAGKQSGAVARNIALWAKGVGLEGNLSATNGEPKSWMFTLADYLVFRRVRAAIGLDRCRLLASGAAPLAQQTSDFFMSLNIPVMDFYGMSESSGIQTSGLPWCFRTASVGKNFPGVITTILNPDENGNGEIGMEGRHVFMGYLGMKDKTLEAFDHKGRLHSGDVGRLDEQGFLYITGRIKELLITAGGENIPPVPIEDSVKSALPCVSNCILIGDKRKFLSMLLTLKTKVDAETQKPLNQLSAPALEWCRCHGSAAQTVDDVQRDVTLHDAIQAAINSVNKLATSHAQHIQKWTILARDFSVYGGELGPTLKLKRPVVEHMYRETINAFYDVTTDVSRSNAH